ncbi:MAG: hypothetical protein PUB21_11880 [Bacteroidales bacterium]|nr:hypothetical protein [Bacteroidales bacterium]
MNENKGFIKLSRKFFSNTMWNEARTYSSCEAWLDLIQSARFEATPLTESIGGREISYSRGQMPASIRFLSKRWNWSEKKVRSYLSRLKKEKMISTESNQGVNIITLLKYDQYNDSGTTKGTDKGTDIELIINRLNCLEAQLMAQQGAQPLQKGHTEGTNKKKEEEINKEDNSNELSKKEQTLKRREEFKNSLTAYADKYNEETIRNFFNYWSEMNKSQTKMRFELEKTWETSKRLNTWARRGEIQKRIKPNIANYDNNKQYTEF